MREILYKKVGRRYIPVSEYDSVVMDALPTGSHLIVVEEGCKSTRYNVDQDQAGMLATFHHHRDRLAHVISEASKMRPQIDTKLEAKAWAAWSDIMGDKMMTMMGPSINDILDALEKSLIEAADKGIN